MHRLHQHRLGSSDAAAGRVNEGNLRITLLSTSSLTGLCYHRAPRHGSPEASQFDPLSTTQR